MTYKFKYCFTCNIVRPTRCSHCSICNSCFTRIDHHCPWFGTCIALHNYKFFFIFLLHVLLCSIYDLSISILYLVKFRKEIWEVTFIFSCGSTIFVSLVILSLGKLFILHIRLVISNTTSSEVINDYFGSKQKPNPFLKYVNIHDNR